MTYSKQELSDFAQRIKTLDKSGMKADLDSWPEIAEAAWNSQGDAHLDSKPSSIIVAGMGGSGITGDILRSVSDESGSRTMFTVLKDDRLPAWAGPNTLVIGISCSGNTQETLSAIAHADRLGIPYVTVGSGGALEAFSKAHGKIHIRTRMLGSPRASMPAMLYAAFRFLCASKMMDIDEVALRGSLDAMKSVRKNAGSISEGNRSLELAEELERGGSPVILASRRTVAAGERFRQSLNETSKMDATFNHIPEAFHNTVDIFDAPPERRTGYRALVLELEDDPAEIKRRQSVLGELLQDRAIKTIKAPYERSRYLGMLMSMIYYLEYTTFYLGIMRGVDPAAVPAVNFLKSRLK
jgi:glucose/mannose-6-phosphate isomerase